MRRVVTVFGVLPLVLALLLAARSARALERVKVLIPDRGNLQYTSFWIADGAGFFREEGIEIDLVVPSAPQQAEGFFEDRKAEVAVLPPPVYANLIAHDVPVVLVANLLTNDPIALVVRKSVLDERKLRPDMPLKQKLEGLRGLKLGIAPHPPARLRVLYASQQLDADKDIEQVILHGKDQNTAFRAREVDALYAHTPFVEQAIAKDDAVIFVDQPKGEVPELANRQIHALTVRASLLELRRPLVVSLVHAIARAEEFIHQAPREAVGVLARMFPERDMRELETIMSLYEPAIPKTPLVSAAQIPMSVTLFPAGKEKPDLSKIDLKTHVAPELVETAKPRTSWLGHIVEGFIFLAITGFLFATRAVKRRRRAR